jgi:hypothetical protein
MSDAIGNGKQTKFHQALSKVNKGNTARFITSATGKRITQATVYTNPFYYPIKVPEQ